MDATTVDRRTRVAGRTEAEPTARFASLRRGPNVWVSTFLIVVLTYLPRYVLPKSELDSSWQLALSWAYHLMLQWGEDIAYTYGPWGFLNAAAPLDRLETVAAFGFWLAMLGLVAFAMFRLGEVHGRWIGFAGAFFVCTQATNCGYAATALIAVVLLCCAMLLGRTEHPAVLIVTGLLAGFSVLMKFNLGVTGVAVALLAAAALYPRWSRIGLMVGSIVVGFVGGWVAASQSITNIPAYFVQSVDIALHYRVGLGLSPADQQMVGSAWPFIGIMVVALVVGLAMLASKGRSRIERIALAGIAAVTAVSFYTASGIRLDPGHAIFLTMFVSTIGVALALAWQHPRFGWLPIVVSAALAFGGFGAHAVISDSPPRAVNPVTSLRDLAVSTVRLFNDDWQTKLTEQRAAILRANKWTADSKVLAAMDGRKVHAEPWMVNVIWAAGLGWRPVPVFQAFQAYSATLDELNAQSLTSGPTGILRQSLATDGKNVLWESPRYQVQLMCNFDEQTADASWQALVKVPDRCGAPTDLKRVDVKAGESVNVPSADGLIMMNVNPAPGGGDNGATYPTVTCDGHPYRIAQGFPSGPLVVNASDTGWSTRFLPKACKTVSVSEDSSITFSAVPIG